MKIEINNFRKIFAIKEEFNVFFPDLEIEFYEKPNTSGGSPSEKLVKHDSKNLGDCRVIHNSGFLSIFPGMTAGELKHNFSNIFGLSIELFIKNGNDDQNRIQVKPEYILGEFKK